MEALYVPAPCHDKGVGDRQLPHVVPINRAEFLRDTADSPIPGRVFRPADILVRDDGENFQVVRLPPLLAQRQAVLYGEGPPPPGRIEEFLQATAPAVWKTLFESEPCMPFDVKGAISLVIRWAASCSSSMLERCS